jgi:hypothetical protein
MPSCCRAGSARAATRRRSRSSSSTTAPASRASRSSPTPTAQLRHRDRPGPHRRLDRGPRQVGRLPGPGPEVGGDRRYPHRPRRGRRHLPAAEEGPHAGVPPRDRAPAPALEPLRRRLPHAQPPGLRRPPVLPAARASSTSTRPSSPRATARARARCSASPRSTWAPADDRGGNTSTSMRRTSSARRPTSPSAASSRGDLRLRAVQHLHLRPHLPRRELQHLPPRGRVLDDRAGDGLLRPRGRHGPRRGIREAPHPRRPRTLRRRPRVLRQVRRQGTARAPRLRARAAVSSLPTPRPSRS